MSENKPLILVTNDDSVFSRGIKALMEVAQRFGEVYVVAPQSSNSGMSHAITVKIPIRLHQLKNEDNLKVFRCSGTPADSVKIALDQVLPRKPDLILSGINHGSNSSVSVIYSGTMGAVIEGALNEIPSVGFSHLDYRPDANFSASKFYAEFIIRKVLKEGLPENTCLNVNIPVGYKDEIKGVKVCRQAKGTWREKFVKNSDPRGLEYYWLSGSFFNHEPESEETDEWALQKGYVTVVPITVDFTSFSAMNKLRVKGFEL